ncbi:MULTISPECIES: fatty acid--CoA ligase [Mycobacteriaceae]|uniref:Long-chain-fatty-acid--CoA ligase FadD13 n=8 Tax=Mycobacteriaceae TaxID=1762 RepID=A0A0F5MZ17_9MYCO|nr:MULTISPECIES: fatty acid--CoA ligase [Mycobacteriaceae]KKB99946.1 long-chain fatty acid--CoA ligase [Mycolicibacter arupensis]KLI08681.1 long-chain fatty acid--CoA ligase [Mycolicibacterium senegalense]KUI40212.1 long-chain fatty acid--CoA ligase [Mycobacterium sp. GA-2829]MBN3456983.1 fatty acid--CoA ligase [Mycobacterium sp. DSM 3803]MCV7385151.1 fatty acid--CoA ligase [Mycolicibacter longobardus]MCV7403443.1 fatty acid--CoA ligase [Mycobacterium marseillense]OBH01322.1 long-chain fatty
MRSTMQDVALTVPAIVAHASAVHGDREVLTARGPRQISGVSYREVGERAARLANALRQIGIRGDERVATLQWSNQEHLDCYAAVPSMGAVLHTLNLRLPPEQLTWIANHAEDRVIIVDSTVLALLAAALPSMTSVRTVLVTGTGDLAAVEGCGKDVLRYDDVVAAQSSTFDWPDVDEQSAAAMCYTSGTTGHPKGVVYSHRSTWLHSQAACTSNALGIGHDDTVLAIVPMFHANAWGLPYAAMMAGAQLLLPDRFLQAGPLVEMIEAVRPTMAGAVPTIWTDVLHYLRDNPGHDVSSLKMVACGGSAVPRSLMTAYDELGIRIVQAWGMTETSPLASVALPRSSDTPERSLHLRATQGRVVAGVQARIVDDSGAEQPWDGKSVGEIQVRGPWITQSYYENDSPAASPDGWLRTGDVGTISADAFIALTDRSKDVIKSGGEWISSVELENELAAHPAVRTATVIGVPDDKWQERPLAVVVLAADRTATAAELTEFLRARVAKWWLPERWAFVTDIPLTSTGKFDKKKLRRQFGDGDLIIETLA